MPKKKKVAYDPYARLCKYTCCDDQKAPPIYTHPGDFTDTGMTISPALPRSEVGLSIQFRTTVHVVEGDVVIIHLPNFKGMSKVVSLEMRPHPDGLNMANNFQAYWSGDEKRKGRGKNGVPNKQQLMLKCIKRVEENTLVFVGVPLSASIVSPDKLPANSAKIKVEGRIRHSEGGRIPKQSFLSCTEIKKKTAIEEMEVYTEHINGLVESVGLSKEMRYVGEEIGCEEVDQLWESLQTRNPLTTELPFPIAVDVFRNYEDSGDFIKIIMENTVRFVKARDPLALHQEVATNWGVKVGAVVMLEDILASKYAGLYPKLTRAAILATHLLLMKPADVLHLFPGLDTPPAFSIYSELISAFRMRSLIGKENDASAIPSRSVAILKKWTAMISILMVATTVVDEAEAAMFSSEEAAAEEAAEAAGEARQPTVTFAATENESNSLRQCVYLQKPPPLYVGLRDLPQSDLAHVRSLTTGDWYMFPSFTVARESFRPLQDLAAKAEEEAAAAAAAAALANNTMSGSAKKKKKAHDSAVAAAAAAAAAKDEAGDDDERVYSIPDNAIVFEIRTTVDCLEMADLSASPSNCEWLLPLSSSFRVVSVNVVEDLNDLTHVVLDMKGSLGGSILDDYIPDGDRSIASVVIRKVLQEAERSDTFTQAIALLTTYNIKLAYLRRFHPPTLLREQYLTTYRENKLLSESKQALESGTVVWQVCVNPAHQLEEGVIKPAVWETINRKIGLLIEHAFRGRSRVNHTWGEIPGGITSLSFQTYTVDYAGKGPRPIRRMVKKAITHEAPKPVLQQLKLELEAARKQLKTLTNKIGK